MSFGLARTVTDRSERHQLAGMPRCRLCMSILVQPRVAYADQMYYIPICSQYDNFNDLMGFCDRTAVSTPYQRRHQTVFGLHLCGIYELLGIRWHRHKIRERSLRSLHASHDFLWQAGGIHRVISSHPKDFSIQLHRSCTFGCFFFPFTHFMYWPHLGRGCC